jgi:small subunit ribosomal protein S18
MVQSMERDMERQSTSIPIRHSAQRSGMMDLSKQYAKKLPSGGQSLGRNEGERSQDRVRADGMARLQTRPWQAGDVYAPHDLTPPEMKKWRVKKAPTRDVFDMLNINPLDEWKVS